MCSFNSSQRNSSDRIQLPTDDTESPRLSDVSEISQRKSVGRIDPHDNVESVLSKILRPQTPVDNAKQGSDRLWNSSLMIYAGKRNTIKTCGIISSPTSLTQVFSSLTIHHQSVGHTDGRRYEMAVVIFVDDYLHVHQCCSGRCLCEI